MLPRHISIWIVPAEGQTPGAYVIGEFAEGLKDALAALGYDAPIITDSAHIQDWAIVLLPNRLPSLPINLPEKLILFNMEQVQKDSFWFASDAYVNLLKKYPVWDYSVQNISTLRSLGIDRIAHCGIGYMPSLSTISKRHQDIDVLFYGSINARRQHIIDDLLRRGVHVLAPIAYGERRNAFISRAKIVLNMHYYEAKLFEIVRASLLLANHVCVVSETGNDLNIEEPYREGIAFAPYEKLVDRCVELLADAPLRDRIAETGFTLFSQQSQTEMVKGALEATFGPLGK